MITCKSTLYQHGILLSTISHGASLLENDSCFRCESGVVTFKLVSRWKQVMFSSTVMHMLSVPSMLPCTFELQGPLCFRHCIDLPRIGLHFKPKPSLSWTAVHSILSNRSRVA